MWKFQLKEIKYLNLNDNLLSQDGCSNGECKNLINFQGIQE